MHDSVTSSKQNRNQRLQLVTEENLVKMAEELASRDDDLAQIVARFGPPPLWAREPGFATLVSIILEQQVSLASAKAAFTRLQHAIVTVTPENFLPLDDTTLKAVGFSRQKIHYCRLLAQALLAGTLDLPALGKMDDDEVRVTLKQHKGIGDWTADLYLLMALHRSDVWPKGDLALFVAMQRVKRLSARPKQAEFDSIGEPWRPYRAVAARLLWHDYLCRKKEGGTD